MLDGQDGVPQCNGRDLAPRTQVINTCQIQLRLVRLYELFRFSSLQRVTPATKVRSTVTNLVLLRFQPTGITRAATKDRAQSVHPSEVCTVDAAGVVSDILTVSAAHIRVTGSGSGQCRPIESGDDILLILKLACRGSPPDADSANRAQLS